MGGVSCLGWEMSRPVSEVFDSSLGNARWPEPARIAPVYSGTIWDWVTAFD